MNYRRLVNSLESLNEASDKELCLFGFELPDPRMVVSEVAALHQIHDQVERCLIVKRILYIDDEIRVYTTH
jgi:hypothetical protein